MADVVFLAGAAGVIGRAMVPRLLAGGWHVTGTTRSTDKCEAMRASGITPVVVDVFDAAALSEAVSRAKPRVVVHQLTDLTPRLVPGGDPGDFDAARARNARLREEGTRNLVAASLRAGAERLIAQSISFAYAPGSQPYRETDPLNIDAPGSAGVTARGVAALERQVLDAPLHGIVLRYGRLYGPGTGAAHAPALGPLHVEAAAGAACLALTRCERGVYNIAEDDGFVDITKARRDLGWPL